MVLSLLSGTSFQSQGRSHLTGEKEGAVIPTKVILATFHLHDLLQEFRGHDCPILNLIYYKYLKVSFTYDHRTLKTRLPVRSALFKQRTGGLVVRWVTTSEYPLLYVFLLLGQQKCFCTCDTNFPKSSAVRFAGFPIAGEKHQRHDTLSANAPPIRGPTAAATP